MDGWLAWVIGAAALAGVLVALDRLTAAGVFDRRRRAGERERRPGGTPLGGAMGAILDVYDPSHRHVTEEQQRQKSMTVQKQGEGPPLVDVDLEAGVAQVLPRPARGGASAGQADSGPQGRALP